MRKITDPRTPIKVRVPVETVKLVRIGVLHEIGGIATRIAEIAEEGDQSEVDTLPDVFEHLDEFRVLLAGTNSAENKGLLELDIDRYGEELKQAIEAELSAQRDLLDVDSSRDGAEQQREKAQRSIDLLQALLDDITRQEGDEGAAQQE